MKHIKKLVTYSSLVIYLFLTVPAHAQIPNPLQSTTDMDLDTLPGIIEAILKVVVQIGSIILVFMIIYSGYLFVTAQGNMEQLTKAKHTIKWAVLGGALLLGAWALSVGIGETIAALA